MNLSELYAAFQNPGQRFRVAPLLRVNDTVDPAQLRWQLETMKSRGFGGIFLCCEVMNGGAPHKFLSDWWWEVVDLVARLCAEVGLDLWIYDEEDWPSGSAGGQLTEAHPEYRWKYLHCEEHAVHGPGDVHLALAEGELAAVVAFQCRDGAVDEASLTDLTDLVEGDGIRWHAPSGDWTVAVYTARPGLGLFLDSYGDLMDREAMGAYLDWVYRAHYDRIARIPGARITGYFTDEPAFSLSMIQFGGRFPWYPSMPCTPGLEEAFRERHGYSWRRELPLLYHPAGPDKLRYTCHYWETCRHLYHENYFGQIHRFCEDRGVKASGHLVIEEDFLNHLAQQAGNLLCHFRHMHVPGMDWIHAFEGRFRNLPSTTPKYPTSMAHLMGREQTWAETFAASGWGLNPREMRRLVNWEHVNGISLQVPICYKHSLRGENRGRFYVPGISYQQPYWDHIQGFADYEARACALAAGGGHVAQVALAYPEVDIWMHCWDHDLLNERSATFNALGDALRFAGYDYDILDDEAFLAYSRVEGGRVATPSESFRAVVVPGIDGVRRDFAAFLLELVRGGGIVVFTERLPRHSYDNGGDDPELADLLRKLLGPALDAQTPTWHRHPGGGSAGFTPRPDDVPRFLSEVLKPDVQVEGEARVVGYRRRLDDGHLYLLLNCSDDPVRATVSLDAVGHAELWRPQDGARLPVESATAANGRTRVVLGFAPQEMVALVLRDKPPAVAPSRHETAAEVVVAGPFAFHAEETFRRPEVLWNFSEDAEGLEHSAVCPVTAPGTLPTGDWQDLGLATFSGIGTYSFTVEAPAMPAGGRVVLDLGRVGNTAEVRVNGASAGVAFFEPHQVDITELLRPGSNALEVRVANTLSNYMAQFPAYAGKDLANGGDFPERRVSGLLGPVRLCVLRPA